MDRPADHDIPAIRRLPLRVFAAAVMRNRLWLILSGLAGAAIAAAIAIVKPNVYASECSFLLRRGGETIVAQPSATESRSMELPLNAPSILTSNDVAERVVRRVGADKILDVYVPEAPAGWAPGSVARRLVFAIQRWLHESPQGARSLSDAVRAFRWNLQVSRDGRSGVIQVRYSAFHPERAQEVLQAFVEEAQKRHLEVYGDDQGIELVERRHRDCLAEASAVEREHGELLERCKITGDFEGELGERRKAVQAAKDELRTLELRLQGNEHLTERLETDRNQMKRYETVEEVLKQPNPQLALLQRQLFDRKSELAELRTREKRADAPEIVRLERIVASLSEEVRSTPPTIDIPQVTQREREEYLDTCRRLRDATLQLATDRGALPEARARVEAAQGQLSLLSSNHDAYRQLSIKLTAAHEALAAAERDLAVSRNKTAMLSRSMSSLALIDAPSFPVDKDGPQRGKIAAGGGVAALFLAVAVVFVAALGDKTVRSREDLELTGIRVLASVPSMTRKSLRHHHERRLLGLS